MREGIFVAKISLENKNIDRSSVEIRSSFWGKDCFSRIWDRAREIVNVTGNKNLIQREESWSKSMRFEVISGPSFTVEFYFILFFFSLFFLRLFFPPIRLRVLYPVLVNIRGRKRKKFKKVFSGNCWEESYPQLEGKFHPSYLNFCPAFVALEREKFLGQFSPNVQIPSNFPRVAFRDNFAFQTFSRIFNPPSKKRNGILFLFLRYSISHCQRIRLPFPFLLPLSSNFIVQSSRCALQFSNVVSRHMARTVR